MHLRGNYTAVHDQEAFFLYSRFVEKGYDPKLLQSTVASISELDRTQLLANRSPNTDNNTMSILFITTFSVQHRSIKKLIQKHWHILGSDQILSTVLPSRPQIVFKGASSIRDRIAPTIQDPRK